MESFMWGEDSEGHEHGILFAGLMVDDEYWKWFDKGLVSSATMQEFDDDKVQLWFMDKEGSMTFDIGLTMAWVWFDDASWGRINDEV
ncbi:hypothetical protein U1Q18_036248 [Sarracenia purpurea var. burkii]